VGRFECCYIYTGMLLFTIFIVRFIYDDDNTTNYPTIIIIISSNFEVYSAQRAL